MDGRLNEWTTCLRYLVQSDAEIRWNEKEIGAGGGNISEILCMRCSPCDCSVGRVQIQIHFRKIPWNIKTFFFLASYVYYAFASKIHAPFNHWYDDIRAGKWSRKWKFIRKKKREELFVAFCGSFEWCHRNMSTNTYDPIVQHRRAGHADLTHIRNWILVTQSSPWHCMAWHRMWSGHFYTHVSVRWTNFQKHWWFYFWCTDWWASVLAVRYWSKRHGRKSMQMSLAFSLAMYHTHAKLFYHTARPHT